MTTLWPKKQPFIVLARGPFAPEPATNELLLGEFIPLVKKV